jgi:hypothetical protein
MTVRYRVTVFTTFRIGLVNLRDRLAVYITVRNSQILLYLTSWHLQRACTRPPYALRHG